VERGEGQKRQEKGTEPDLNPSTMRSDKNTLAAERFDLSEGKHLMILHDSKVKRESSYEGMLFKQSAEQKCTDRRKAKDTPDRLPLGVRRRSAAGSGTIPEKAKLKQGRRVS